MSKQTQLPWASSSSSSSSRGQRLHNGGSKDDRDIDMKDQQPAHLRHRTIYKANRSNSVTPNFLTSASLPQPAAPTSSALSSAASSAAVAASSSVLGKRSSGQPSPFVFLDGVEPLDYTDFTQTKLPVHTLLYLCADRHYNNKHIKHTADDAADRHDTHGSSSSGGSSMDVVENGKDEKDDKPNPPPPQPDSVDSSVRYDAIAPTDDEQQPSILFSHHPFHRLFRTHKAALAAWKHIQGGERDSSRVMEFACREALHVLHVTPQQREAVFATSSSSSSSSSSTTSAESHLPSPPPLLSHLLSAHNGCVGYEVEGEEADGIVLTSSACECQLSLLDDDKRAHVSQALLTDMFARLHC